MKHIPKRNYLVISLAFLTAVLLIGCAMPTTQSFPRASEDKPPANKCLIIVKNEVHVPGAWISYEVYDNGKLVGTLTKDGKLAWLRDPGPMRLHSKAMLLVGAQPHQALDLYRVLTVAAGTQYNYRMIMGESFLNGPGKLHSIVKCEGPPQKYTISNPSGKILGYGTKPSDLCKDCGYGNSKPDCPAWVHY